VNKYSYFRENLNCLTQFTAAFDGCFVYRYTKDFKAKEKINVRYVLGPKNRVLFDIVNQAKNITLPVISMEQKNVKRDSSRIQFKDQRMTRPHLSGGNLSRIPMPVPVTMDIDVSIVTNYKEDIDQIASNIIPWCNPYFIISWKIPEEFALDFIDEIRTEVTWSGNIDYENPTNIEHSDKYKIVGTTSFNVKGWIFPELETTQAPIYVINTNFVAVSSGSILNGYDDYRALSANNTTDSILISAYPEFTNYFINGIPYTSLTLTNVNNKVFGFYGKRFDFNNQWYLSSNNLIPELTLEEIKTAKFPTISAYRLPDSVVTTINDNIATIKLSSNYLNLSGSAVFITVNSAGWAKSMVFHNLSSNTIIYNGIKTEFGEYILSESGDYILYDQI
jgi:hypothetical protein